MALQRNEVLNNKHNEVCSTSRASLQRIGYTRGKNYGFTWSLQVQPFIFGFMTLTTECGAKQIMNPFTM